MPGAKRGESLLTRPLVRIHDFQAEFLETGTNALRRIPSWPRPPQSFPPLRNLYLAQARNHIFEGHSRY